MTVWEVRLSWGANPTVDDFQPVTFLHPELERQSNSLLSCGLTACEGSSPSGCTIFGRVLALPSKQETYNWNANVGSTPITTTNLGNF